MFFVPYVLIVEPLAATKEDVGRPRRADGDAGNTEMSAPLSTRYSRELERSLSENDVGEDGTDATILTEGEPGATAARRERFPKLDLSLEKWQEPAGAYDVSSSSGGRSPEPRTCKLCHHISCE